MVCNLMVLTGRVRRWEDSFLVGGAAEHCLAPEQMLTLVHFHCGSVIVAELARFSGFELNE